ncbi:MAG: S1 RNA-binding domain-containing protein, partial [Deinococcus sp.]|nr:S1 RNA-binding domain-containing protein [Deinococcus sp.]
MEDKATQTPASSGPEQKEVFSMEAALQDADARLEKSVQRGSVIKGSVIFVGQEGVSVDIGARAEGIIPFNQLTDEPLPEEDLRQMLKPGDEVTVYVVRADLENGQIILSKKRAEADNAWGRVQELFDKGEPVTVSVLEKVKGGLVAQVAGIRAFLPASQVDLKRTPNLDEYVGKDIPAKIIELNRKKGRVILSRRVLLEAEQKERSG